MSLDGGAPASMHEVEAWRGRTYSVETPGTGDSASVLQTGYVVVKVMAPVSTMPTDIAYGMTQVGGTAVFTGADDGIVVTEAGVPAAHQMRDFTVVLDSIGRSDTGADPSVYEAMKETQGSVTVTSDVAVAAVTIRQNDDPASGLPNDVPTLTVFPVIPGRAGEMAAALK